MEFSFKWFRKAYNKAIHNLGFFPVLIAAGFLALAIWVLELDARGVGEMVNRKIKWLTLKDAATATTIASTIAASIISLMVFSFSMVMVVMNQAASQMSNRLLDNLIGGKFQKLVLSFYIGTIIFAFVLLSNTGGEANIPILSIYLLILLAIIDIFLFVNFLHYNTQSIRYEQLIQAVHRKAKTSLEKFTEKRKVVDDRMEVEGKVIMAAQSGYYQGFSADILLRICEKENIAIRLLHVRGDYVLEDTPLLMYQPARELQPGTLKKIFSAIDFFYGQEIDKNPYYGFMHLMEAGVKALSPGINDPGTAVFSLNAIADLLAYRLRHQMPTVFCDRKGTPRIVSKELTFEELFSRCVLPIWDYGRNDRLVQNALLRLLKQLRALDTKQEYHTVFQQLETDIRAAQQEMPFQLSKP